MLFLCSCSKNEIQVDHCTNIKSLKLWVDTYEVSTARFGEFIDQTNYTTTADSLDWSAVFSAEKAAWIPVDGANWQKANGKDWTDFVMPVTQVSYYDACAFCEWAGGRLPTAEEWDKIAGDRVVVGNVWQGMFPFEDKGEDGFVIQTAPIGSFKPNAKGVHDLFGNVWEWTSTSESDSLQVIKGGSFLCDENVCSGYIPTQYQTTPKDSGLNHLGFRCVYDTKEPNTPK